MNHFDNVCRSKPMVTQRWRDTAEALNLITFRTNKISMKDKIWKDFEDVSTGIGRMKDVQIKLHIDETVDPVGQQSRRIPSPLREKIEKELEGLEKAGIIEKVYGPIEWLAPIVIQPKRNSTDIRIYVDMREANKAILHTRHTIPNVEEIRFKLNGAKVFSKIDLTNAYHHLVLHPSSRSIITFTTHMGLRRYSR